MKETGIVRRIDELGRVVIPKEIRKTLRIKEGDPLEIFTDRDELMMKKYSPVQSMGEFAESFAESLAEVSECVIAVFDTDVVLYLAGGRMKDWVGRNLSDEMEKTMRERKSVVLNTADGGTRIPLLRGEPLAFAGEVLVPVIADGDVIGGIALFSKEREVSSQDVRLVQVGANFLSRQFS